MSTHDNRNMSSVKPRVHQNPAAFDHTCSSIRQTNFGSDQCNHWSHRENCGNMNSNAIDPCHISNALGKDPLPQNGGTIQTANTNSVSDSSREICSESYHGRDSSMQAHSVKPGGLEQLESGPILASNHAKVAISRVLDPDARHHAVHDVSNDVSTESGVSSHAHEHDRGDRRSGEHHHHDPRDIAGEERRDSATREEQEERTEATSSKDGRRPTRSHDGKVIEGLQCRKLQPHWRCGEPENISEPSQSQGGDACSRSEHVINRSISDEGNTELLLRPPNHIAHMPQTRSELDATILSLSSGSRSSMPVLYVDRAGQVRSPSTDDVAHSGETQDQEQEKCDSVKLELREHFQSYLIGGRHPEECHQEEGEQKGDINRLGEGEQRGQWMCSRMESSWNECPPGDALLQALWTQDRPQLQDSGSDQDHANRLQEKGKQEEGQEEQQVSEAMPIASITVEKSLKSGLRKRILGDIKDRITQLESEGSQGLIQVNQKKLDELYHVRQIGEVFSPPRFTKRASRHGLSAGHAFDLELGNNFLIPSERQRCVRHLREEKYGLVTVSSPCTMFSALQFLANGRTMEQCFQDPVFVQKYKDALTLLTFGVTVCMIQREHNGHFVFEQPWSA